MPTYSYEVRIPVGLDTSRVPSGANDVLAQVRRMVDGALAQVARLGGGAGGAGGGTGGGRGGVGGRAPDDHVRVFREQQKEVARIQAETARQATERERERVRMTERLVKTEADIRVREAKRAANELLKSFKDTEKGAEKTSLSFGKLFGANFLGNLAARAITQAGRAVLDVVQDSFERAASFDSLKRGLKAVTGSAEEAERQIAELQELARQPGIGFREAVAGATRLEAVGISAGRTMRILREFANAVALTGGSKQNLEEITVQLGQMAAKGKVLAQDLRPIISASPAVAQALKAVFGTVSSDEIAEKVSSMDEFFEKLLTGMEKLPRAEGGARNALDNLSDSYDRALITFGEPLLEPLSKEMAEAEGALLRNQASFKEWGGVVADTLRGVRVLAESEFGSLVGWLARTANSLDSYISPLRLMASLAGAGRPAAQPRPPGPQVFDFGNGVAVDMKTLRPPVVVSKEDQKLLEKQKDLVADLQRELQFFGDRSAVAATKQKLLAAGVTDLNSGLAAQAVKLAAAVDRLKDAADVAELVQKKLKETEEFSKDTGEKLRSAAGDARRQALDDLNETLGFKPGAEFKFEHSALGIIARGIPSLKTELDEARDAFRELDVRAGQVEAFRKRKASLDQLWSSLEGFTDQMEELTRGTRYVGGQRTPVDDLFEGLYRLKELRDLGVPKGAFDAIHRFVADMGELDSGEVETLRMAVSTILLTQLPPGTSLQQLTVYVEKIIEAVRAAQAATKATSPVERARESLEQQLGEAQEAISISAETASLRYQLAWQDAFNDVALADDRARVAMIQSQARLADMTVYHAEQAQAAVMDFLASQRSVTEVIADAKTGVISTTFDLIDRGLERATGKLGIVKGIVHDLLSGFIRLALSPFFSALYGGGGGQARAGGGGFGSLLGGIFGGGRGGAGGVAPFLTGGFAGGTNPAAALLGGTGGGLLSGGAFGAHNPLANFFGQGGIAVPQAATGGPFANLSPELRAALAQNALDDPNGFWATQGAAGGLFGQARGALGGIAPLLGLTLGASLGGSSRAGNILGGAGGLLGGLLGSGLISGGLGGSLLGGMAGNIAGFLGLGGGLLGAATLGIGAAVAIAGALILGRNAQRRKDETTRNAISTNTGTAIWDLIDRARSLSLSQARQEWAQIDAQYHQQIAQLKDGKARRHAELQWTNDFAPMWNIVETRVREGEKSREFKDDFVPTFAAGGAVRAFSDGGSMSPFTGRVPGVYDRRDDRVIRVSGDETVLTPIQRSRLGGHTAMAAAGVPGYADGVTLGGRSGAGDLPPMQITIRVELGSGDRTRIVLEELHSQAGREAVAAAISEDINREGMEGVLGAVTLNLLRRGYV